MSDEARDPRLLGRLAERDQEGIALARLAVATRLPVGLAERGGWGDTVLPLPDGSADWHDVVTDTAVDGAAPRLDAVLARYPVALLVRPS